MTEIQTTCPARGQPPDDTTTLDPRHRLNTYDIRPTQPRSLLGPITFNVPHAPLIRAAWSLTQAIRLGGYYNDQIRSHLK
ncbi:TonB-dependent receptor [Sesbania bispinosa]|nr:TonB-dependent receptor [Sesbania bispinosa]